MYESPVKIIQGQMETQLENNIFSAIQHYGIEVNRDELVSALMYDRHQYEKGYRDGIEETEAKMRDVINGIEDRYKLMANHPMMLGDYCDGMKFAIEEFKSIMFGDK